MASLFNWTELYNLIQPAGQQQIFEFIEKAKSERGRPWLDELCAEYPFFAYLADLVLNYSAAEALAELKGEYPFLRIGTFDAHLIDLHRKLKEKIGE
jgi:hypothetical protein